MFSKLLSQFVEIAGDWHIGLNILVTIFSLFDGGVLQAFQQALSWNRIQFNPTTCYQSSALLVFLITGEIERMICDMVIAKKETKIKRVTLQTNFKPKERDPRVSPLTSTFNAPT